MKIAIICVGNLLMRDDGLGVFTYAFLQRYFSFDDAVDMYEVGCLSLDYINLVRDYDYIITIDALDETGHAPGAVCSFAPEDMKLRQGAAQSLHDLRLADLFASASLLGYYSQGICFGMQIQEVYVDHFSVGLSPVVEEGLPKLAECVLAHLASLGHPATNKQTARLVLGPDDARIIPDDAPLISLDKA